MAGRAAAGDRAGRMHRADERRQQGVQHYADKR